MKNIIRLLLVMCVAGMIAGCASGQRYDEISAQIPGLKAGYGRIYFTRAGDFQGAGIQPYIRLNGEVVGTSMPGGFFFVDRPAGDYAVATSTEVENTTTFHPPDCRRDKIYQNISIHGTFGSPYHANH
jgi:hypothetical protein